MSLLITEDALIPDENKCITYLESVRWNGIVVSPFVPISKVYHCRGINYKCRDSKKYFSVKTNTIFHNSRIPIRKWFMAIILISQSKTMTSVELSKHIGLTQKTAWYMLQRLRKHFAANDFNPTIFLNREYIDKIDVIIERDRLRLVEWLNLVK